MEKKSLVSSALACYSIPTRDNYCNDNSTVFLNITYNNLIITAYFPKENQLLLDLPLSAASVELLLPPEENVVSILKSPSVAEPELPNEFNSVGDAGGDVLLGAIGVAVGI